MTFNLTISTVRAISRQIQREELRRAAWRDSLNHITTAPYDGAPHHDNFNSSRLERLIVLIDECEARLRELYDERLIARLNLLIVFSRAGLSPPEERVMQLRYCDCLSYEDIAAELSYSQSHVFYLHRQAKGKTMERFDEIVSSFTTS